MKGRIITTLQKAKEVRPLVERCITVARVGLGLVFYLVQLVTEREAMRSEPGQE